MRKILTGLKGEIMDERVRDEIRQLHEKQDHLKQELNNARRKKEPSRIIERLEAKLEDLKTLEKEREEAARDLPGLRNSNVKPFFLWRLHFLEVFKQRDGFDVVIGNPPYILVQT